ncbi:hypothetical protein R3P38DRAFT_2806884 [Favolaschia claudopus]|uniref:Uncharacterized protein n=1 Tax=Favolaschia claudopus TaxID=2862362 RepID=A0AAV9ZI30_9AGAR
MQNPHFTPRPSTPFLRITVPVHLRASLSSKPLERVVGLDIATLSRAQDVGGEMERRQVVSSIKKGLDSNIRAFRPNSYDRNSRAHGEDGIPSKGMREMSEREARLRYRPDCFKAPLSCSRSRGTSPRFASAESSPTAMMSLAQAVREGICDDQIQARFRSQSTIPFAERTRGSNEKVNRFPTKSSSSSTVTQPPPLATRRGRASQSIMIGIRSMKTERWKLSVQENRGGMVRRIAGRTAFRFTQRTKRRRMVIGGIWQGRRIVKEAKII